MVNLVEVKVIKKQSKAPSSKVIKSYKDHLMGLVLGAYEKNFFEQVKKVVMQEKSLHGELLENDVSFNLLKGVIYEAWNFTLIGKVFGKKVIYHYMDHKVRAMWQSNGKLSVLEVGNHFFMFKFELQ